VDHLVIGRLVSVFYGYALFGNIMVLDIVTLSWSRIISNATETSYKRRYRVALWVVIVKTIIFFIVALPFIILLAYPHEMPELDMIAIIAVTVLVGVDILMFLIIFVITCITFYSMLKFYIKDERSDYIILRNKVIII